MKDAKAKGRSENISTATRSISWMPSGRYDLFEGHPLNGGDFEFSITQAGQLANENNFDNHLTLTDEQLLPNVKSIQERNEIKGPVTVLQGLNF